jgi:Kef-type K+ transport system membrane component KefB
MVVGGIALFLLVRGYGLGLSAPAPVPAAAAARHPHAIVAMPWPDAVFHLLLALAAVIVTGRLLGRLLRSMGQPSVMGEILAGICLGPSALGRLLPSVAAFILPGPIAPVLNGVAQLGIVLYMFLVGLELNADLMRRRAHATVAISHASIVAPFLLGALLALPLYTRFSTRDVSFTTFALFMGVALAITAFPVLARILADHGISRTDLGVVALTCAAVDDVTAWCLLALAVGVAQATVQDAVLVIVLTVGFVAAVFLVIRPLTIRLIRPVDDRPRTWQAPAMLLVGLLVSALTAEWIGVHAVFGAFLFGAIVPHDSQHARALTGRFKGVVTLVLLPAFFAFTGMRTEIGLVSDASEWLLCGLIILVATAGKLGGTLVAARLTGMGWRDATRLGILMNTRGLMELIVLNIGLDLGVISPTLFTMMVLMALVTTIATTPVLRLLGAGALPVAFQSESNPAAPDVQGARGVRGVGP